MVINLFKIIYIIKVSKKRASKKFYFKTNIPVALKKDIFDKLTNIFDSVLIACPEETSEDFKDSLVIILKMSKSVKI